MYDKLREALEDSLRIIQEIHDSLYGKNFEVLGWHLNGNTEKLDNWFEENNWEPKLALEALANSQPTAPAVNLPSLEELRGIMIRAAAMESDGHVTDEEEIDIDLYSDAIYSALKHRVDKPAEIDLSEFFDFGWGWKSPEFEKIARHIESQGYKVKIEKGGV